VTIAGQKGKEVNQIPKKTRRDHLQRMKKPTMRRREKGKMRQIAV